MLDGLMTRIENHLLEAEMANVYGNKNAIREERRSRITTALAGLFPALQQAVQAEVSVVRAHLHSAEQEVREAQENVKLAQENVKLADSNAQLAREQVAAAMKTVKTALDEVNASRIRVEDATRATRQSVVSLAFAREEFSRLVERAKG